MSSAKEKCDEGCRKQQNPFLKLFSLHISADKNTCLEKLTLVTVRVLCRVDYIKVATSLGGSQQLLLSHTSDLPF